MSNDLEILVLIESIQMDFCRKKSSCSRLASVSLFVGFGIISVLDANTDLRKIRTISVFLLIGGFILNVSGFDFYFFGDYFSGVLGLVVWVGLVGLLTTSVLDLKNDEAISVKIDKMQSA